MNVVGKARPLFQRGSGTLELGGVSVSVGSLILAVLGIGSLVLLTALGDVDGQVSVPIIAALAGAGSASVAVARNGGAR